MRVWLGQHRHEYRDGAVEVEEPQQEEDSPQEDKSVSVEDDNNDSSNEGDHEENLRDVQRPGLVGDIVQHNVRQRSVVRHELVSQSQAGGVGHPGDPQEQEAHHGLQWLPGQLQSVWRLTLVVLHDVDDDVILIVVVLLPATPVTVGHGGTELRLLDALRPRGGRVVAVENIVQPGKRKIV